MARGDSGPAQPIEFFIIYTCAQLKWVEWIAWQLEDAGYRAAQSRDSGEGRRESDEEHLRAS